MGTTNQPEILSHDSVSAPPLPGEVGRVSAADEERGRFDLNRVSAPPLIEDREDVCLAKEEELSFDEERKLILLDGLIADQEARKNWGERVFWLLVAWLIADFLTVCLQGFGWTHFHVSDSIVITMIGTTTVNVLSLGYIVANYLFPKSATPS